MSGRYFIEADGKGQFIPNYGRVGDDVILTRGPALVELSPPLRPPSEGVATIRGAVNGLYVNLKPAGPPTRGDLVWSEEPYEWRFDNDKRISTTIHGEVLHWFIRDEDTIILNPYASTPFNVAKLA